MYLEPKTNVVYAEGIHLQGIQTRPLSGLPMGPVTNVTTVRYIPNDGRNLEVKTAHHEPNLLSHHFYPVPQGNGIIQLLRFTLAVHNTRHCLRGYRITEPSIDKRAITL